VNSQDRNNNAEYINPTLTIIPTATQIPTSSITPITIPTSIVPTQELLPTNAPFLSTHALIVNEFETGNLIVYDLISGDKRQLNDDSDHLYYEISWEGDGCEIIVSSWYNGILGMSLDGTIIESFPSIMSEDYSLAHSPFLSSDRQYLAYLIQVFDSNKFHAKGGYVMTLTINDLYVQNTADPDILLILSENNSVTEFEWSDFNNLIAFTDINLEGIHQLFVSDLLGGQKKQITSFIEEYSLVKHITWAPDHNSIVFVYTIMDDENAEAELRHSDQLFIIDNLGKPRMIETQTEFEYITNMIYLDDNNLVVSGDEKGGGFKIIVLNTVSMVEKVLFPNEQIDNFSYPIQFYPDGGIGFFVYGLGEMTFATYNITTETIKYYPVDIQGFRSFFGPPEQYINKDHCN
jgi:hypothetical protein